jgi:drug/metabolite transporter (DMT)-like permease
VSTGARYILAAVSCFSIVSLVVKALGHLPFEQLIFWRGVTCLLITYFMVRRLGLPLWGNNKKALVMRGTFGTLALGFFFYTLHTMPLAAAVTIQYLSPIFTVLVAALFFGEKVRPLHWLCSLLGFAGVWIIQGYDDRISLFGALMGVGGALSSAFAYNTVRSLKDSDHEWVVMFYFPLIASVVATPFALRTWVWPQGIDWLYIVLLGAMTQIAQLFLTRGYSLEKASKVAAVNYAGVLFAVIFGIALYGEKLPATTVVGMALILVSVWLSTRGKE